MNLRLLLFQKKCECLPYSKIVKKLKKSEFDTIVEFLEDNNELEYLDFEYAVNRMHLDMINKPKNWKIIEELLTVSNSAHMNK